MFSLGKVHRSADFNTSKLVALVAMHSGNAHSGSDKKGCLRVWQKWGILGGSIIKLAILWNRLCSRSVCGVLKCCLWRKLTWFRNRMLVKSHSHYTNDFCTWLVSSHYQKSCMDQSKKTVKVKSFHFLNATLKI